MTLSTEDAKRLEEIWMRRPGATVEDLQFLRDLIRRQGDGFKEEHRQKWLANQRLMGERDEARAQRDRSDATCVELAKREADARAELARARAELDAQEFELSSRIQRMVEANETIRAELDTTKALLARTEASLGESIRVRAETRREVTEQALAAVERISKQSLKFGPFGDCIRALTVFEAIRALQAPPRERLTAEELQKPWTKEPLPQSMIAFEAPPNEPPRITKEEVQAALKRGEPDAREMGVRIAETFRPPGTLTTPSEPGAKRECENCLGAQLVQGPFGAVSPCERCATPAEGVKREVCVHGYPTHEPADSDEHWEMHGGPSQTCTPRATPPEEADPDKAG